MIDNNVTHIKNLKASFDVAAFKKTGAVIATYQLNVGNDVRYNFKCDSGTFNEQSELVIEGELSSDLFTECSVYIPSIKESREIDSAVVLCEIISKINFENFKAEYAEKVAAKKELAVVE